MQQKTSPFWSAWLRGNEDSTSGGATLVSAYQQSVWVYACVRAIGEQLANTPFCVVQGDGASEQKLARGPLADLFQRPHPQLSHFDFWELVAAWLNLRGECFVIPLTLSGETVDLSQPGRRGAPFDQFALLDPVSMRADVVRGRLLGWFHTAQGAESPLETQYLLPGEVIFLRRANPYSFWRGMSPLGVASVAAQADYASSQFHKGLMLNNADTGVIVTTDQQLDDTQREQILGALKERKRKAGTADRPLFLWGGAKVEKPTLSSSDLQFLENRKFNRQEICAVFGVPQEILGFTEDANRSVGESARLNFIENTCAPMGARIAAAFEPAFKVFGADMTGYFDFDQLGPVQAARRARADTASKYWGMGVPLSDLNTAFDLGLPDKSWHAKAYLPFSVVEVGDGTKATPASKPDASIETSLSRALDFLKGPLTPAPHPASGHPLPSDGRGAGGEGVHVCAGSPEHEADVTANAKLKGGKLRRFFFEQRARVLAKLDQVNKDLPGLKGWPVATRGIEDIFDEAAETELLKTLLKPTLIADLTLGGAQLWKEIGLDDFKLAPVDAIKFLAKRANMIADINATTFGQLKTTLTDGLSAGDTFQQLADRVKEVFQDASDSRAETIAMTETNIAINSGRFAGMKQAGVEKKGWLASSDGKVRASHLAAQRDYSEGIPVETPFRVGGYDLMHPGDPSGPPEEVINCRCSVLALPGGKARR